MDHKGKRFFLLWAVVIISLLALSSIVQDWARTFSLLNSYREIVNEDCSPAHRNGTGTVQGDALISSTPSPPVVTFVPFPHNLGITFDLVGEQAACTWETWPSDASSLLGRRKSNDEESSIDAVQRAALAQGMCLPNNASLRSQIHLFSAQQAIQCLSPAHQHDNPVRLVISGDSYNRQLFIGLADVLLGEPSNENLHNERQRGAALEQASKRLATKRLEGLNVIPDCWNQCMGQSFRGQSFQTKCHWCINGYTNTSHVNPQSSRSSHEIMYTAAVVGAAVHVWKALGGENETLADLKSFLTRNPRVMFNSMPSYQMDLVPSQHKGGAHHRNQGLYLALVEWHKQQARPMIDFYVPTAACTWSNCSSDGGHRSRFVNRWKAQLLLNALCDFHPGE